MDAGIAGWKGELVPDVRRYTQGTLAGVAPATSGIYSDSVVTLFITREMGT